MTARLVALAREHVALTAVLAAGTVLRLAAMVAYAPALFFSDSWSYARLAWQGGFVGMAPDRPNGYAVVLKLLAPGGHLTPLIALQHLAGLAAGVLVYALLARRQVPRWAAAGAAAVVVLDANAIGVEQHVLPEAFVTLTLLVVGALTAARPRDLRVALACGLLLAFAILLRTGSLFAVPVWFLYLVAHRPGWRLPAVAFVAVVLPLAGYGAALQRTWGNFGLSAADGWFLYGRVAEIARCDGLRGLDEVQMRVCRATERAQAPGRSAGYFIWVPSAPANREFGRIGIDKAHMRRSNQSLGELGQAIVRDRPAAYAGLVVRDLLRYFTPGKGSGGNSDTAIELPDEPITDPSVFFAAQRDRLLPDYEPPAGPPAGALHAYQQVAATPRLGLGLLLVASLLALLAHASRRARRAMRHGADVALFAGMGAALLVGSVLTSTFIVRYLLPAAPLLVIGGVIALTDLREFRRARTDSS